MGTLEWQTLLPVASWKQWLIKMAVVFGLVLVLEFCYPQLSWEGSTVRWKSCRRADSFS